MKARPRDAPTLAHRLLDRVDRHPDLTAVAYHGGDGSRAAISYAELAARASAMAEWIRGRTPDQPRQQFAVIALPNEIDYVVAFVACQLAGVTPATFMSPPLSTDRAVDAYVTRLGALVRDCDPAVIIAHTDLVLRLLAHPTGAVICGGRATLAPELIEPGADIGFADPTGGRSRLALLQYTSGSTSQPKGVMIGHDNLTHNLGVIAQAFRSVEGESIAGWLPLHHDMGMIGLICHALWAGLTAQMMAPHVFIRRPALWLQTISATDAPSTVAPNFGYDLAVRRVRDEDLREVSLTCLRTAMNGAEPVRVATVDAFAKRFGPFGFNSQAMMPVYGLAENTVAVSLDHRQRDPVVVSADPVQLRDNGIVRAVRHRPAVDMVGCGTGGTQGIVTRIVDPHTRQVCPDGTVGEIWVTGPSKAQGYWQRPGQSEETFRAVLSGSDDPRTYLRTGDLGALRDGRLFIVGRIKDLIIARGMNLYPQDLEHTAETSHPALRRGGGAAFGVPDEDGERVVLVHELDRFGADVDKNQVISSIRRAVAEIHGVTFDEVCLTGKGQVPRTTSGKVRRRETQRRYLAGELTVHAAWATPTKGATQ